MTGYNATVGSTLGLQGSTPVTRYVINNSGSVRQIADVVCLDELGSNLTGENSLAGDENSTETNVILPATATLGYARFAVVTDPTIKDGGVIAPGQQMEVTFRGRVQARVGAAAAIGDDLAGANNSPQLAAGSGTNKIIAVLKETASGAGVFLVDFDGLTGHGLA